MIDPYPKSYFPFGPVLTTSNEENRKAYLLFTLGWVWAIVATICFGLIIALLPAFYMRGLKVALLMNSGIIASLLINRRGHYHTAAIALVASLWLIATGMALTAGGISSIPMIVYLPIIITASLLLGGLGVIVMAILCISSALAMALLETYRLLPSVALHHTPLSIWMGYTCTGILIAVMQYIAWHQANVGYQLLTEEITERRKMEARLRESEFNNRMVVENKILGVAWASPDGRILDASATFCGMLGYSAEELRGIHFGDFTHPDDTAVELALIDRIMSGEINNYTLEKRYKQKGGTFFWVELYLTCYRNQDTGAVDFLVGLVQDIQKRKTAEYEQSRTDARYRSLMEQASDAIMITDIQGRFLHVNDYLCQQFGYTREELLQMNISSLVEPTDLQRYPIRFEQLAPGASYIRERRMIHKDGTVTAVEANVKMTPDGTVLAIARDITERKVAEQQIVDERDLSDSVISSLPGLFFILSEQGRFLRWNRNFELIAGYNAEEIHMMNAMEFFDEDVRQMVAKTISDTFSVGPTQTEVVVKTKNNNREPHYFTGEAIQYKGQRALLVSGMDITERVEARNAITTLNESLEKKVAERTAELHDANRELETFNYSVSHDLQAPLRLVNGFAKVLLKDYGDKLDDDGRHSLQIISTNTVRMSQLIRDLLEFSKSGRGMLTREEADMSSIVLPLIDQVKIGQAEIRTEFVVHKLDTAHADANLIKQVWANLILNAVKFSGKEEKPVVEIGSDIRNGEPIYYVRDNGVGFDMQHGHKLFHAFQRLHSQSDFEGSGVGLATCHRIVSRHGGRIWAEAMKGQGATFYFTLPA